MTQQQNVPNGPFLKKVNDKWVLEDSEGKKIDSDTDLTALKQRNGL